MHKLYLQRPRPLGGMALPNFRFYYWAAKIRILKYLLGYEALDSLVVEANSANPASLKALIHAPIHSSISSYSKNVLVKNSCKICGQFKCHFGLQS